MAGTPTAVIPVRSFHGLSRLAGALETDDRIALMQRLVEHTTSTARIAGLRPLIVTNDARVTTWAGHAGVKVAAEGTGGLNAAAAAGVAAAADDAWLVVHADLPLITPSDIAAAIDLLDRGIVLAPSHDGGTSLIGGTGAAFPFAYGPGSFRRHLSAVDGAASILVRRGLALDLDRPWDLGALGRLERL